LRARQYEPEGVDTRSTVINVTRTSIFRLRINDHVVSRIPFDSVVPSAAVKRVISGASVQEVVAAEA
jgi:hypothetical protein